MWDIDGDSFDSFQGAGFLDFAVLSLDDTHDGGCVICG